MDGVKLPTFDEVKASGAKPEPGVHLWMLWHNMVCCVWCGSTNRESGKPCKGVVGVAPR